MTGRTSDRVERRGSPQVVIVDVPLTQVQDDASFHAVFAATLGFADYYGRNRNAFTDILTYPQATDVALDVPAGGTLVLRFDESDESFKARCPDLYDVLAQSAASITEAAVRAPSQPGLEGAVFVALAYAWPN
jgi:RNAse (barnase) inhibitor barstar